MFGSKDKGKNNATPVSWKGTPVVPQQKSAQTPKEEEKENPFLARAKSDAANKIAEREKFKQAISTMTPEEKAEILRNLINRNDE